ncbi:MAG: helix-turn-helix domain-containing protein [Candidatus Thorarchaeota archaeon]
MCQSQLNENEFIKLILEKLSNIEKKVIQNEKPFLDINQAAEYLNLSKFTLYTFTSKRLIPFHKAGRKIYFAKSDLDKFALNKNTRRKSQSEIEEEALTRVVIGNSGGGQK